MKKRALFIGSVFLVALLPLLILISSCSKKEEAPKEEAAKTKRTIGKAPPQQRVSERRFALVKPAPPGEKTAPESLNLAEIVKQRINALGAGKILFNPPAEMKVDKRVRVVARIAPDMATDLTHDLQGPGSPIIETIKVSPFMKVSLQGDNFHIDSYSDEEQPLVETSDRKFAQWQWDVTPSKSGTQLLVLSAKAVIKIPNNPDVYYDYPVLERQIHVKINPGYSIASFMKQYWQWLATTIIIPLIIWLYNRRRKGQENKPVA